MIETIILIFIIVGLIASTMKKPKNYPPGPMPLPILGSYLLLDQADPQKTVDNMYKKFGTLVGMIVPKYKVVFVSGYEAAQEAFFNENIDGRPTEVCLIRDRFEGENYGILLTDGESWKSQRRFTLHHFRNLGFGRKNHESVVIEEAEALVAKVRAMDGKPFKLNKLLVASSINITWALLGSQRYDYQDPIMRELASNIKKVMHGVKVIGSVAIVFPFLRYLFPNKTGYNSVTKGSKGILDFTKESIKRHSETRDKDNPRDFIDIYLQELKDRKEDPEHFSEKQLQGICMDLLLAGADTSSAVVGFSILFLCFRKDIQEKMFQEILENVADNRTPSTKDKQNLVYTEATLMEVLRYRSPGSVGAIPHRATKDTTLSGYHIPKDTILLINLKSIFMDPNYWTDPDSFQPERFITSDGKLRRDARLIPFGKGKRSCLGETLAKMTTFILLSALVQNFKFSLPSNVPVPDTKGVPGVTLAPPAFLVKATPRIQKL